MSGRRPLPVAPTIAVATVLAGALGVFLALSANKSDEGLPFDDVPANGGRVAERPPPSEPPALAPAQPRRELENVEGRVVDTDGKPVVGAKLRAVPTAFIAMPTGHPEPPPAPALRESDALGLFHFNLSPRWSWTLQATRERLSGLLPDVQPPATELTLVLVGAQTVRGRVAERGGAGVGGVQVVVSAAGTNATVFEAQSAADGAFAFEAVPLGPWRVEAIEAAPIKPGSGSLPMGRERRRAERAFTVGTAPLEPLVLELPPLGRIRGRVTAPAGTDLTPLEVFAVPAAAATRLMGEPYAAQRKLLSISFPSAKVAADGQFELDDVAGALGLLVPHSELSHPPVSASPGDAQVVVALARQKTVRGRVADARTGHPVPNFEVNGVVFRTTDGAFSWAPFAPVGAARSEQPEVRVTAAGFAPQSRVADLSRGDADLGVIRLEGGRVLTLQVLEDASGQPLRELAFQRQDPQGLTQEHPAEVAPGRYRFDTLPFAGTSLTLIREGGARRTLLVGPTETEVTYRFTTGTSVRGVITGPNGKPAAGARVFPGGDLASMRLTDNDGRYALPGLAPGPLKLVVQFGRASTIKSVDLPASGELELNITLEARE